MRKSVELIRYAKFQCKRPIQVASGKGTRTIPCFDLVRVVRVGVNGRVNTIKCMHGHVSRGKYRELVNPLKGMKKRK